MKPQELRALCLSFNAAVEDFPFNPDTSVFKVLGKMFALADLGGKPLTVNLKCDPEDAIRLRTEHEGLIVPGWHMNKRHWNTVSCDGSLPDALLRDMVEDSYDLVVSALPKRVRDELGWP